MDIRQCRSFRACGRVLLQRLGIFARAGKLFQPPVYAPLARESQDENRLRRDSERDFPAETVGFMDYFKFYFHNIKALYSALMAFKSN